MAMSGRPCVLSPLGPGPDVSDDPRLGAIRRPMRVPAFVEDPLSIFAKDNGLGVAEVRAELDHLLETDHVPVAYPDWMETVGRVESAFGPRVVAFRFRILSEAASVEFQLDDLFVLEFLFASIATLPMPGDPVWGFIVGPPSALKTEFLRWLNDLPQVYTLSRMTPHSLISGLKGGHSLLPELDQKVLVIKDFTTVLEMDRKSRDEVFGQLRDSFDGYYEGFFGSVGKLSFEAHFHVLAAVTPAIEEYWSIQSTLGPRFLKVRCPEADGFERCLAQGGREGEIRSRFAHLVRDVVGQMDPDAWKEVRFDRVAELRPVVELLARGRTHVSRSEG
jgi:hypothetical protein